jgi:uncharacterized protein
VRPVREDGNGRPPPDRAVTRAIVALGRALRGLGLTVSVDEELVLCRALAEVDIRDRAQVYWAARSCMTHRPDDAPRFDAVFGRFWEGLSLDAPGERVAEHGETDPRMPGPRHGGESLPQFRPEGRSVHLLDGGAVRGSREFPTAAGEEAGTPKRRGALAAYSPDELVAEREPLSYAREELAAVRRLAQQLERAVPERLSRRARLSRRGRRLDLRRTVRRSLRTDGEALEPAYIDHTRRPRRLLVLCDVSGSMERYSRALLGSLQAVVGASAKAEAFVFATRLTRLTGTLRDRDLGRALDQARATVADWSGGTRIGQALREFNAIWTPRGLARGAITIIVSDGWDRGDPELLARELGRLRLQARRLIWINPRPTDVASQPLAVGMRAALPNVDDFIPGHDPRAMAGLASLIGGLGPGRPARRQRTLDSVRA